MSNFLSKSDFKACLACRTKLYYRKSGYPTNLEDNEYLQFLADGGFMVEFVAKAKFPDGIDLVELRDPVASFEKTKALLSHEKVTLFEAAATVGGFHVRTDILQKSGSVLNLIEVKSSSLEDDEDDGVSPFLTGKGAVKGRWKEYLLDVAYQTYALRLAFPHLAVKPTLCVVNKSRVATEEETLGRFSLIKSANAKARPTIKYHGELAALEQSGLLSFRDVTAEVELLMPEVVSKAAELVGLLADGKIVRIQEDISELYRECRVCEYRTDGKAKNGFRECWGKLANVEPHMLELHRVGQIATKGMADPVPAHLKRGQASYLDLSEAELGDGNSYTQRRLMQWGSMRAGGQEFLPSALRDEVASHQTSPGWPLHFVDFEACDISLPHHAGLHPYERVAFQWSCHTLSADGVLSHREWLNTENAMPNFAFVRSLAETLGEKGTVYVWSPYEQVTLRKISRQIQEWLARDEAGAVRLAGLADKAALVCLADWVERLLGPEDAKGKRVSPRIRDLHKLALEHYFHPRMGGRTSIKVVLPSIWQSDEKIRAHPCFRDYLALDSAGQPLDPYKALPALPFGDDDGDDAVREGTGAIRMYQDMLFARDTSPEDIANRRQLLLQYCGLDTAAMVMIWMHWLGRYDLKAGPA
jgi:hypothetical protein